MRYLILYFKIQVIMHVVLIIGGLGGWAISTLMTWFCISTH